MQTRKGLIQLISVIGLILISGFLYNCSLPSYTPDGPPPTPTDPPQQTKYFTSENGEFHFYTNEVKYLSTKGCSFWIFGTQITPLMDTFEIQCYKTSGDSSAGYGVIFSVKDINNFLTVLINTNGKYLIGKNVDNVFTTIQTWTTSSSLISGYGSTNIVKIVYNSTSNHYEIYFNNTKETEFEDIAAPIFDKVARYGYIACISPNENYPSVPTDIHYKQLTPADIQL